MSAALKMGILGCGDYLRWQKGSIQASTKVTVKSLFDPDGSRAARYAAELGGRAVDSAAAVLDDPDVDVVCLFVPPWIRKDLVVQAAAAGKHILTTKPLAPSVADCVEMMEAVEGKVRCGVQYRRTENAFFETLRAIFESGEIGRLALYKQDWLHHYPQWNEWATDPQKNGGPFMDAMVHNMNIARYLMDRPATHCTYFSDDHAHPNLKCNDTEFMKLDFADGGSAHLFITWAADLEVYDTDGNNREHIDLFYMITDRGWRLTEGDDDGHAAVVASKEGQVRKFRVQGLQSTVYDGFVDAILTGGPLPSSLPGLREAAEDIKIMWDAGARQGRRFAIDLSLG